MQCRYFFRSWIEKRQIWRYSAAHTNSPRDAMLHSINQGAGMAHSRAGQALLQQASRRTHSDRGMLEKRRAQLGERLRQIASAGPCTAAGQRYALAQNVGSANKPLWVSLCVADQAAGRLVFSGNRMPVEFTESQAIELTPLLGAFMGAVGFQKVEGVRA